MPGGVLVVSGGEALRVDRLVVCAGLQADRVSRWVDGEADPRIVPFRGEYMTVRPEKRSLVRGMVYPVPDPRYPFLGVHFTRRVSGELEVGPNAVLALAPGGLPEADVTAADVRGSLAGPASGGWPGGTGGPACKEVVARSRRARLHARCASGTSPRSAPRTWSGAAPGSAPRPSTATAACVDDFRITESDGVTCIRNAPSPAATSSLAIAEHVADRVLAS